jgi:NTE family protein
VATDFDTGAPVMLRQGSLRQAVTASSAIPAVMPPCRIDGRVLIDGGVVADVPVRQARQLVPGPVLAVETSEAPCRVDPDRITVPRALLRAGLMTQQALRDTLVAEADLALRPSVDAIHWSDFSRVDEAIEAGRAAALAALHAIRKLARVRPADVQRGSSGRVKQSDQIAPGGSTPKPGTST